jgi:hypothetical protein
VHYSTHGYEPTREAAMAAFAKSWRWEQLAEAENLGFHACCGVVRNCCWYVSAPRGTLFEPSAAPLPPAKTRHRLHEFKG